MTEQEKQKLNEKLAKWAGFTWYDEPCSYRGCSGHCGWRTPDGITIYPLGMVGLPKFTDSFDACLKWLAPKLFTWNLGKNWELQEDLTIKENGIKASVDLNPIDTDKWDLTKSSEVIANDPAPALCLAIEKSIDKERVISVIP